MSKLPVVLCLMGPTAVGKSDLALHLCDHFPCDIVSVDSALVYRNMNIGTAKPSNAILDAYPHRLINIRDPAESYSAGEFCADAKGEIAKILEAQRIPLLVGGTMLYFHTLQKGLAKLPSKQIDIREKLKKQAELEGWKALYEQLQTIDPLAASHIHSNDSQRIQRALEVYLTTGLPLTHLQKNTSFTFPNSYRFVNLAILPDDRSVLHQKIENRFQHMLKQGLVEEVEALYKRGDLHSQLPSLRCVGYRQIWDYLEGNSNYETMREKAIIATRQLAKHQLTWLRRWDNLYTMSWTVFKNLESQIFKIVESELSHLK